MNFNDILPATMPTLIGFPASLGLALFDWRALLQAGVPMATKVADVQQEPGIAAPRLAKRATARTATSGPGFIPEV